MEQVDDALEGGAFADGQLQIDEMAAEVVVDALLLSLIHISEPTRLLSISYAVFCLKKTITKSHILINHPSAQPTYDTHSSSSPLPH